MQMKGNDDIFYAFYCIAYEPVRIVGHFSVAFSADYPTFLIRKDLWLEITKTVSELPSYESSNPHKLLAFSSSTMPLSVPTSHPITASSPVLSCM